MRYEKIVIMSNEYKKTEYSNGIVLYNYSHLILSLGDIMAKFDRTTLYDDNFIDKDKLIETTKIEISNLDETNFPNDLHVLMQEYETLLHYSQFGELFFELSDWYRTCYLVIFFEKNITIIPLYGIDYH